MLKKVIILLSLVAFQSVSYAVSSKNISEKDKKIVQENFFTIDNFSCSSDTTNSIEVKGNKLCTLYSPIDYAYYFNSSLKPVSSIKEDDYNYKALENISGLKLIKQESTDNDTMKYYNPEMLQWVFDRFYQSPDSTVVGKKANEIYDVLFKNMVREYVRAYIGLNKNNLMNKGVNEYKSALKNDTYAGADFVDTYTQSLKLDVKDEIRDYEDPYVIGFWLRRDMDGTINVCWNNLKKLVQDYDSEWFKKIS